MIQWQNNSFTHTSGIRENLKKNNNNKKEDYTAIQ